MPANISFVFNVNPGRNNLYNIPGNNMEIKALSAVGQEVWVVDASGPHPVEALILRNDINLATSVVLQSSHYLEFYNPPAAGLKPVI